MLLYVKIPFFLNLNLIIGYAKCDLDNEGLENRVSTTPIFVLSKHIIIIYWVFVIPVSVHNVANMLFDL